MVAFLLAGVQPADAAPSIAAKRREAARISAAIDQLGDRIEQLNEDYNDARVRLEGLQRRLGERTRDAERARARIAAVSGRIRERALAAYTQPFPVEVAEADSASSLASVERRSTYRRSADQRDTDALDELRAAQQDLGIATRRLAQAKAAALAETRTLAAKRAAAQALERRYSGLERQTRGELAVLVRRAEAARSAAEARAARAAAASRRSGGRAAASVFGNLGSELPAAPGGGTAVQWALGQLGKPYIWGAAGPGGFDCSGLMLAAWRAAGRNLPHSSRAQYGSTTRISVSAIKPGDLVFFGSPIHHVGLYVGGGQMVEASRRGRPVRVSSIYRRDLVGVGRVG